MTGTALPSDTKSPDGPSAEELLASPFLASRTGGDPGAKITLRGTQRTVDPEATLERLKPRLGALGITRIANVTHLDRIGIPVTMVVRPNSRSIAVSQGKGLTLAAAKASGVMESVETHHAERIALPLRLARESDLREEGLPLIDIAGLPRIAGDDYEARRPMLWIEGWDLMGAGPLWLPFEPVHANFTLPLPQGSGCFVASTNGLSSGNQILESLCHGLCETIERDATALWHGQPPEARGRTRLDLATVDDAACCEALERLEAAGFEVAAWEATSDIGIPSFQALILDRRQSQSHPGVGAGCHPSRGIALLRALLEAAQVRMTYIAGSRDDLMAEEFTKAALAEKVGKAERLLARDPARRAFGEAPSPEHDSFAEDLSEILTRLRSVGIRQAVAIDLSPPEGEYAVTRVVVPGLEGPDDDDAYVPGPRALARRGGGVRSDLAALGAPVRGTRQGRATTGSPGEGGTA